MRIAISHGSPKSDVAKKIRYYRDVATALRRVAAEDAEATEGIGGERGMRSAMWMADHNMVLEPALDELRGTTVGRGAKFNELLAAYDEVREQLGMTHDVIRDLRGARVKAFTHGVRRIDRIEMTGDMLGKKYPKCVAACHVEQEELELVLPAPRRGWRLARPGHKAVDVIIRVSDNQKDPAVWKVSGRPYPKDKWKEVLESIEETLDRQAQVRMDVGEDGQVKFRLKALGFEERQIMWQDRARKELQDWERKMAKTVGRKLMRLRKVKNAMIGRLAGAGAAGKTRLVAQIRKLERELAAGKIKSEMERVGRRRQFDWTLETRQTAAMHGGLKRNQCGTGEIMGLRLGPKPEKGAVDTREVQRTPEGMKRVAAERWGPGGLFDAFGGENEEQEEHREIYTQWILGKVKRHMEERDLGSAMEGLSLESILGASNLHTALKEMKKGTVPANDGFDIDFYARHAKLLVPHLQGLFREILERGDLTEAMKEATVVERQKLEQEAAVALSERRRVEEACGAVGAPRRT